MRLLAARATAIILCLPAAGTACSNAGPGAPRRAVDLIVSGGTLITMDGERRVIEDGGVAILDGVIVAVDTAERVREAYAAADYIEARARDLVLPGLVNGHGHAAMTLFRGLGNDLALMGWLEDYIFPAEARTVSPEMVRAGTLLAALEMIRSGTTTFADMYYFEEEVARVVDETGLRAIVGETVIGFPVADHATPEESLAWIDGFVERWKDHPRVIPAPAPHAPYTVPPEVLRQAATLARRHGVPLLIHLAETADEVEQISDRYGVSPVRHLSDLGFLGPDVIAAHAIWLDDADIALLAASGVGTVHNPESNMKLASGTMPVAALRAAGVAVGLGTDGAASNNDLDLFDALALAPFLQKHATGDPRALPAAEAVAMATIEGARALGLDERIGSLEVGKRADLIVLDGDEPALVPLYDPYAQLAYAAGGQHVRATVVEGRILYLDGDFRTLDPALVVADARAVAERIREAVTGAPR